MNSPLNFGGQHYRCLLTSWKDRHRVADARLELAVGVWNRAATMAAGLGLPAGGRLPHSRGEATGVRL
jgi:hypothetical protein